MAHTCPDCGTTCHCGGDIDDINFGEAYECRHYQRPECVGYDGDRWDGDCCDDYDCDCGGEPPNGGGEDDE